MSNYSDDSRTEQNKTELFSDENTMSMSDFDYLSSLNEDYSKGPEQAVFVDDTDPDLTESPDQQDPADSSWETGSMGSISDYLNIDKPLDPSEQASGLSGTVSWGTDNVEEENNPVSAESSPPSPEEDGYREWTAPRYEAGHRQGSLDHKAGHRQGSLNPLHRQGSLHPSEPSPSESEPPIPPTPPTPPTSPTPSWQGGGMSGQETGKRPAGKGKKTILLWGIVAVLAAAVLLVVLNSESRTQYHIGGEQAKQTESGDGQAEQKGSGGDQKEASDDPEVDFGDSKGRQPVSDAYADFYTPKYISTEPVYYKDKYLEACVVDPGSLIGTASDPVLRKYDFRSSLNDTRYSITYFSGEASMSMGFSFAYASPDKEYDQTKDLTNMDIMFLPAYADQDQFFESLRASYEKEASEAILDTFGDLKFSDIKSADVSGHKLSYMETTFKGYNGIEVFDVVALEERPEGYGFASMYRCPKSELSDGEDALNKIYEMLSFHTKEQIPDLDAVNRFWPESRIYNPDNSRSVLINVSDFIESGSTYQNEKSDVAFYGGDFENGEVNLYLRYLNSYKILDDKSFDDYIKETLKDMEGYNYKDIQEHSRKEFRFDGCDVHYFSYDYVMDFSDPWNYRVHSWLLETPEGEEISLEMTYEIKVPDDPDSEEFLKQHITLEK